jgi:hypothetical protein
MHKARELSLYGAKVGHAALVKNSRVRTTLASQSVPVRAFWNANLVRKSLITSATRFRTTALMWNLSALRNRCGSLGMSVAPRQEGFHLRGWLCIVRCLECWEFDEARPSLYTALSAAEGGKRHLRSFTEH